MASGAYLIQRRMAELPPPGCPIRIPTDQSRLRLPVDFRSLLRPSSPDGAKASVVCPYTLDRNGSLRVPVYTLQFFLPKNYALFKELPPSRSPPRGPRGIAEQVGLGIRPAGRAEWWA